MNGFSLNVSVFLDISWPACRQAGLFLKFLSFVLRHLSSVVVIWSTLKVISLLSKRFYEDHPLPGLYPPLFLG
jgi:hypothetical protein